VKRDNSNASGVMHFINLPPRLTDDTIVELKILENMIGRTIAKWLPLGSLFGLSVPVLSHSWDQEITVSESAIQTKQHLVGGAPSDVAS
jgi:hypothetical protein